VVTEADNLATIKDLTSRITKLAVTVQPKANAGFAQSLLQFSRQLQRFELDAHVAVTLQGRGQKSSIAHLHASGKSGTGRASKHSSDARRSSVGRRNDEDADIVVAADAASSASLRKPAGTSKGVAVEDQWICEYCNRGVKNTANSVTQHCNGETHVRNVAKWPPGKALAPFQCPGCATQMVNDAKNLRDHRKECAGSASARRIWHCDACNMDMLADPPTVHTHNESHEHQRLVRWAAEQNRDGQVLASAARDANGAASTQSAPSGNPAKRQRKKK
jgi:hypothetical protein